MRHIIFTCGMDKAVRNRVHANRLKKCVDPDARPTNTKPDDILVNDIPETSDTASRQLHPERNATNDDNTAETDTNDADPAEAALTVYSKYLPLHTRSQGNRFLRDYLVLQIMREQFHIAKNLKGKAKKVLSNKQLNN